MTLDEMIRDCEEKAKKIRAYASEMPDEAQKEMYEYARNHEQLVKWLEELVELRSQRASEYEWCKGCKEHDEENHCCRRLSNFIHTQAKEIHDMAYEEGKNDRPQGEWIDTGSGQECSICCEIQYGYDNFRRYCPNCGAKMEGVEG